MNDDRQAGMAEALRLTRAGRLAEATAVIQRTLGNTPMGYASTTGSGSEATSTDAEFRVVDASPPSMEPSAAGMAHKHRRRTVRLPGRVPHTTLHTRPVVPEVMPSPARAGGQFVDGTFSNTAGTRAYKLYIPSGYTGQALPLVVMLHGCSQRPVDFAAGTRMNVLAENETFLVAYPEQAPSANGSKCWNWFRASDQQRDAGEPSLIAGITRQIMSQYMVDGSRVYVAGLSSGGAMAAIMATTYPDLYAAVGVHSGLAYGIAHDLPSAFAAMQQGTRQQAQPLRKIIPLITFHGDSDTTVAPVNADYLLDQWQAASSRLGNTLDVKGERGQVARGHAYSRRIYHDASGHAIIEQWTIHQAGHAWSGGSPNGSYTDPQGPDASREMLRFFTEHPSSR